MSETKLHEGRVFANINLNGYKFNRVNSLTNAGGVGLHVKERIKFSVSKCVQRDLSIAETLSINVTLNDSSTVVGIVYRALVTSRSFAKKERPFYIMGDFNIDLLKISKK